MYWYVYVCMCYRMLHYVLEMTSFNSQDMLDLTETLENSILNILFNFSYDFLLIYVSKCACALDCTAYSQLKNYVAECFTLLWRNSLNWNVCLRRCCVTVRATIILATCDWWNGRFTNLQYWQFVDNDLKLYLITRLPSVTYVWELKELVSNTCSNMQ